MAAVRDQFAGNENTDVVIVTFTDPDTLSLYDKSSQYGLPIVIDPDRSAYRAFGLESGSFRDIWGLATIERYVEIFRTDGFKNLKRPVEDTRQLGGDFVIDPSGKVVYGHWSKGPADRPDVADLVAAIDAVERT